MGTCSSHSSTGYVFSTGARLRRSDRIIPLFLPFAGCPGTCVFCAQDRQTGLPGMATNASGMESALAAVEAMEKRLASCERDSATLELAFYGGTFTAMPDAIRLRCLELYRSYQKSGLLACGRCSTRPDAVSDAQLEELRRYGLNMVELGVQSFDDNALTASRRGYDGATAARACLRVRERDLSLGIQLLPGMPGVTPEVFLRDVERAIVLRPDAMRFYPCLVPEGTDLAGAWRNNLYAPWTLEETVTTLGRALAMAWEAGIPVIRLAVAPEEAFDRTVLAGPRHPALGSLIQGVALQATVERLLVRCGEIPHRLRLPRRCQGFIYGDKGTLRPWWKRKGLDPGSIEFTDHEHGVLLTSECPT